MEKLKFYYINWKGEKSLRTVQDPKFWFGETQYHKCKQWLIRAYDLQKQDFRDFAVKDILTFIQEESK